MGERKDGLVAEAQDRESGDLGSSLASATDLLYDLGQVTFPFCISVFSINSMV